MDEMDRMFRRLVHNVRAGFPDLLTRSFEVSALYQTLIPYRLNRSELGIDSAEEYELTVMRLLAGGRGLLHGDPDMQAALQAELESPNPDLSIFRAWATASLPCDCLIASPRSPSARRVPPLRLVRQRWPVARRWNSRRRWHPPHCRPSRTFPRVAPVPRSLHHRKSGPVPRRSALHRTITVRVAGTAPASSPRDGTHISAHTAARIFP
jgi:hypothetical protein